MNRVQAAGIINLIGIIQFFIFLQISEYLYPGYSVSNNYISDLGVGPSAYIFNTSIMILGILGMIAAFLLYKWDKIFSILIFISSIGVFGVGLFPENMGILHLISSLITFLFTGITAIYSYKVDINPSRFIWPILGLISLSSLTLFINKSYLGLGKGGMERMIVYPVFIWLIGISVCIIYRGMEEKNIL